MDLAARLEPAPPIETGHSGYFSQPTPGLDPRLFDGTHFKPALRREILGLLYGFWKGRYNQPETWSRVWVAGSGVSYQWHGDRGTVGDLDVLVGVDMTSFIQHNPDFGGIPENAIAQRFNNEFNTFVMPGTKRWHGQFELTLYVNPGAADITDITPYAAYDLTDDEWTVPPIQLPADWGAASYFPNEWHQRIGQEVNQARTLVERYNMALSSLGQTPLGSPQRRNAEVVADTTADQASTLYEDIHNGRKIAFAPGGKGYRDWFNFRWQSHKRAGTEQSLRAIHDGRSTAIKAQNTEKYGMADLSAQRAVLNASLAPHRRQGMFG